MNVYKHDRFKFDKPFLSFQAKNIFNGKSQVFPMKEFFEAEDKEESDGNTLLLECENNEYVFSGRVLKNTRIMKMIVWLQKMKRTKI